MHPVTPMVDASLLSGAVQLLISAGFATLIVQLLLLRQNRRKIEGEASGAEANAASVLSGAALQQVESARAGEAAARKMAQEAVEEQHRLWTQLNTTRWDLNNASVRVALLEAAMRAGGVDVPPVIQPEPPPPLPLPPPSLPLPPPDTSPPAV